MTRQLTHSGTAGPLTLSNAVTVPPTGSFQLTVDGSASGLGWPTIPTGSAIVITVGRGTASETKYLVSAITSNIASSTLTIPDWGRGYDGTTPVNLPVQAKVEHTVSAAEMSDLNTHLLTKSAHGATGDLVDQNSAQALTNKTFPTPPPGDNNPATKKYVDDAAQATATAALQKSGGTMTGNIAMGGNYLLNIGQSGAANDAATVGQVNAVQDSVPKGGRALVTFDGSGNAAITHGWGSAPTWAQLTVESPFSVFPHLMSISSTVLNVRASSPSGIITSDSVYMHWLVGV
jgi:hypothetical protein